MKTGMDITKIAAIVKNQFPEFIQADYPKLISFMESYYQWLSQEGNTLHESKNFLDNIDIDKTLDRFVAQFKYELADVFPQYNKIQESNERFENYFGLVNENTGSSLKEVPNVEDQDFWTGDGEQQVFNLTHHPKDADVVRIAVVVDDVQLEEADYFINDTANPATLQLVEGTTPYPLPVSSVLKVFYEILGNSVEADEVLKNRVSPEERSVVDKKHYDNKKLLLKKIKDFYKAKGSEKSYEFLFRVLFNTDVDLKYPKDQLLKPSFGDWSIEYTIKTYTSNEITNFKPVKIVGNDTNSSAVIEMYETSYVNSLQVTEYHVSNIEGSFDDDSYTIYTEEGKQFYETGADAIVGFEIENPGQSYLENFPLELEGTGDGCVPYIKKVTRGHIDEVLVVGSEEEFEEVDIEGSASQYSSTTVPIDTRGIPVGSPSFTIPTDPNMFWSTTLDAKYCRSKRPFELHFQLFDAEGDVYVNISVDLLQRVFDFIKGNVIDGAYDINGDGVVDWKDKVLISRWLNGDRDIDLMIEEINPTTGLRESLFPDQASREDQYDVELFLQRMTNEKRFDVNFDNKVLSSIDGTLIENTLQIIVDNTVITEDPDFHFLSAVYDWNTIEPLAITQYESLSQTNSAYFPDDSVTHRLGLPLRDFNNTSKDYMFELNPYGSYDHKIKIWTSPSLITSEGQGIIDHAPDTILFQTTDPNDPLNNTPIILGEFYNSEPLLTEDYTAMDSAIIERVYIKRKPWGYIGRGYVTGERVLFDNSITGGTGAVARITEVDNLGGIVKLEVINSGHGYKRAPFCTIEPETEAGNKSNGRGGLIFARGTFGEIEKIGIKSFGAGYSYMYDEEGNQISPSLDMTNKGNSKAVIKPIIGSFCEYDGRYFDSKGFLSDRNVLPDNYYYQDYSYVIRVNKQIDEWRDIVKKIIHPAGLEFFGEFVTESYARRLKDHLALVRMTIEIIKNLMSRVKLMDGSGRFTGSPTQYISFKPVGRHITRSLQGTPDVYKFNAKEFTPVSLVIQTQNEPDKLNTALVELRVDGEIIATLGDDTYPLKQNDKDITQHNLYFEVDAGDHEISLLCMTMDRVTVKQLSVYLHNENCAIESLDTRIPNNKRGGVTHGRKNFHVGAVADGANPRTEKHVIRIHKRLHQIPSLGTTGRSLDRIKFRWRNTFRFEEMKDRYSPARFTPEEELFAPYGNTRIDDHDFENMSVESLEKVYSRNEEPIIGAYVNIFPKNLWITSETKRPIGHGTLGPSRKTLERYKLNSEHTLDIDAHYIKDISVQEEENTYPLKMNATTISAVKKRPVVVNLFQSVVWNGEEIVGPQYRSLERDKWAYSIDDVDNAEFTIYSLESNYKYKKNIAIPPSITVTKN